MLANKSCCHLLYRVKRERNEAYFSLLVNWYHLRHVRPDSQPSFGPRMEVEVYESSLMDRIVHSLSCYFPDKRSHILSDKKNKIRTLCLLKLTPCLLIISASSVPVLTHRLNYDHIYLYGVKEKMEKKS